MLSVIADRGTVDAAIHPLTGQVWVCAENAPEQFVIGGSTRVVDAVEVLLEARRVRSKRLAVPSPFHTPLLARSAEELAAAIETLAIRAPAIPTFSSTTAAATADPAAVRESLVRQMTETVRWIAVVEALHAAGVRTFVEVGPSGVLTGLARRILEGREGCTFLQFDQRGRPAEEHLARLREQLEKAGAIRAEESPTRPRGPLSLQAPIPRAPRGTVVSFDATARRRHRNRAAASPDAADRKTVAGGTRPAERRSVVQAATVHGGPRSSGANGHAGAPAGGHDAGLAIETFLVDFVVEQTGYPPEIVELDADLEADLGIDSIKKAQLFGEIGEYFAIPPRADLALDDFPTLRHVLGFLVAATA
jgi:acyl transferase domain-containing protein